MIATYCTLVHIMVGEGFQQQLLNTYFNPCLPNYV